MILFFGNLIYIIFGSTNLQEWDDPYFLKAKEIHNEDGEIVNAVSKSEEP